jgi:hypothetical protein
MNWVKAVLLVGLGAAGFWIFTKRGLSTRAPKSAEVSGSHDVSDADDVRSFRDELADVKAHLRRVEAANGALVAELAKKGATAPGAGDAKRSHPALTPADLETRHAAAVQERREQIKVIDATLAKEKSDRSWTAQMESRAAESGIASLEGVKLKHTDCRETICRLDFELVPGADPTGLMALVSQLPSAKFGTIGEGLQGESTPIVYVTRNERGFPSLAPPTR